MDDVVVSLKHYDLLLKHYEIQADALNEIKEMIAILDLNSKTYYSRVLIDIENVANYASQVRLTNPIRINESRKFIADLQYDQSKDILSQARA